jgi:hypothetical protein
MRIAGTFEKLTCAGLGIYSAATEKPYLFQELNTTVNTTDWRKCEGQELKCLCGRERFLMLLQVGCLRATKPRYNFIFPWHKST